MARRPKPWYRKSRKSWFVTIDGVQHPLGPDKRDAFERFYELMRAPQVRRAPSDSLVAVCDKFLDWVLQNRSADTFEWYRARLQQFVRLCPDLRVADLRPFHVQEWVDSKSKHSPTTKRNNIRAIKRCLNWASQQGYIDRSPIAGLPAPSAASREIVISAQEFETMLSFVRDEAFTDLLIAAYDTGCRPQELLRIEARHVDLPHARWILSSAESKGKKMPRVIYLTQRVAEITAKLVAQQGEGHLFCNRSGKPWTKDSVGCAFDRLQVRMGKAEMRRRGIQVEETDVKTLAGNLRREATIRGTTRRKTPAELLCEARRKLTFRKAREFAPRYSLYALRHTWATNALRKGVDSLTVAILMGHKDPSMLARVYQHLSLNPDHLLTEARRAAN